MVRGGGEAVLATRHYRRPARVGSWMGIPNDTTEWTSRSAVKSVLARDADANANAPYQDAAVIGVRIGLNSESRSHHAS